MKLSNTDIIENPEVKTLSEKNESKNQTQLLIVSFILYIIPVPLVSLGGLIVSIMATGYRAEHIKSIKVYLVASLLGIIGYVTAGIGIGFIIIIPLVIYYYWYMISNLIRAMQLKDA